MADAKKPDKKDAKPAPPKADPFVEIVTWIFLLFLAMYFINGFVGMFLSNGAFSRGWSGLTPQGIIMTHTRPISSLLNPIGMQVVSTNNNTSVYDFPAGKKIGSQPFDASGKILRGPIVVNGDRYWYVDFKSGADGWVKESDIAYLQSQPSFFENVILWLWSVVPTLKFLSVFLSILLAAWIVYIFTRLEEMRKNEQVLLYPNSPAIDVSAVNPKWEKILAHVESSNENDWRLAVIEADIILSEILDKLSLPGDTMGDKMKAVEKSDFTTIDLAWEGHKIRNQIAHEGSDFVLTQRETRRVIGLYKAVFEEFQII